MDFSTVVDERENLFKPFYVLQSRQLPSLSRLRFSDYLHQGN